MPPAFPRSPCHRTVVLPSLCCKLYAVQSRSEVGQYLQVDSQGYSVLKYLNYLRPTQKPCYYSRVRARGVIVAARCVYGTPHIATCFARLLYGMQLLQNIYHAITLRVDSELQYILPDFWSGLYTYVDDDDFSIATTHPSFTR